MREPYESDVQFKLHAEPGNDNEEPNFGAEVEDLRLEKLNHRVTLIAVMIPVLLIIVLAIAYFDIKNRVTRSQDTDLMEFSKLSTDLDSRFSSLSLRQAALEESIAKTVQEQEQIIAKISPLAGQLAEMEKSLIQLHKNITALVPQKEFQAARENLLKQINEVSQTVDKADNEVETMTRTIKSEIAKMSTALNGRDTQIDQLQTRVSQQAERLNKLERSATQLDNTKITKADLDLALRLESLKTEQAIRAQIEGLQTAIKALESKVARQSNSRIPTEPTSRPSTAAPSPARSATTPIPPVKTSSGIEEQTIGR